MIGLFALSLFSLIFKEKKKKKLSIFFMGTGCSNGVPQVSCLTNPLYTCLTCKDAIRPNSKNKRRNTSIMIQKYQNDQIKNILIDWFFYFFNFCGKFFYHSAVDWFPKYNIQQIDAVVITHNHIDSFGGLDDLRDFSKNEPIKIHLQKKDLDALSISQPYLVNSSLASGSGFVPKLQFFPFFSNKFEINGILFESIPVYHGGDYLCMAYKFENIVYMSDVSEIPKNVYPLLMNLDILILDTLAIEPSKEFNQHKKSHLFLKDALEYIEIFKPKKTYLIGMCHRMNHDEINERLPENVELAYDGQMINIY